jgi:hypothetical protein
VAGAYARQHQFAHQSPFVDFLKSPAKKFEILKPDPMTVPVRSDFQFVCICVHPWPFQLNSLARPKFLTFADWPRMHTDLLSG